MNDPLPVLHLIPYLGKKMGGPVYALASLTEGLGHAGVAVTVACPIRPEDGPMVELDEQVELLRGATPKGKRFRWSADLARQLAQRKFSLVHSHGLWTYASCLADRIAREQQIPHLLAPCGMLQEAALRRVALKKKLAGRLYQNRILERATCLHAKSDSEHDGLRAQGFTQAISVIANPVAAPTVEIPPAPWANNPDLQGKRIALFVGRIHPVKGLDRLCQAWHRLGETHRDWHLILAGPDEGDYLHTLRNQIHTLKLEQNVHTYPALDAREKWSAYAAAELFIMPSDCENFGTAIAEAMLSGTPVLTTEGSPWNELPDAQAGWWVPTSVDGIYQALQTALASSPEELQAKGEAARQLAKPYSAKQIVSNTLDVYAWLTKHEQPPHSVLRQI